MHILAMLCAASLMASETFGYLKCHSGDPSCELDKVYFDETCPSVFSLLPDGKTCEFVGVQVGQATNVCYSFCQSNTTCGYEVEHPFVTMGYMIGPRQLTLGDQYHQAVRGIDGIVALGKRSGMFSLGVSMLKLQVICEATGAL